MRTRYYFAVIIGSALMLMSTSSGAWVVEEDFDGQNVGARCEPFWEAGEMSYVSSNQSSSGSKSCVFKVNQGSEGWGGGFGMPSKLRKGDEVWIRFRLFLPPGFDYNSYAGDHLKFVRIEMKDDEGLNGRLDWIWNKEGFTNPHLLILERDTCTTDCWSGYGGSSGSKAPVRGTWETYEMYVKFDHVAADNGGQGRVRLWKNGSLIGERTNRPTMWPGSTFIQNFNIFSYWNGGAPAQQELYFDDLVSTSVTPGTTDSSGNPYIGVGNFVYVDPPPLPKAPTSLSIE